MGALLSIFKSGNSLGSYTPNFANAAPSEKDKHLHEVCTQLIDEGMQCAASLKNYQAATDAIRRAIVNPNQESECFGEVLPNMEELHKYFDFSAKLSENVEAILIRMAEEDSAKDKSAPLEALAVKYAELLKVAIQWDYEKMLKTNLQNDLAFYRRCMDRQSQNWDLPLSADETTHLSMFLAQGLPMLNSCMSKCKSTASRNAGVAKAAGKLSEFSRALIKNNKFEDGSPYYELCMYSMAGSFVIFDAINTGGGFKSNIVSPLKIVKTANTYAKSSSDRTAINNQVKSLIRYGAPNFDKDAKSKLVKLTE